MVSTLSPGWGCVLSPPHLSRSVSWCVYSTKFPYRHIKNRDEICVFQHIVWQPARSNADFCLWQLQYCGCRSCGTGLSARLSSGRLRRSGAFILFSATVVSTLCRVRLFATPWTVAPPGSSVHGILQARGLEWGATASSRVFLIQGWNPRLLLVFPHWALHSTRPQTTISYQGPIHLLRMLSMLL